jgi:hypothetical protein
MPSPLHVTQIAFKALNTNVSMAVMAAPEGTCKTVSAPPEGCLYRIRSVSLKIPRYLKKLTSNIHARSLVVWLCHVLSERVGTC